MDQALALTSGQQFNPNTQSLNDSLRERAREGGGGGCYKTQREERERKMERQEETVSYTEFKRKGDKETD